MSGRRRGRGRNAKKRLQLAMKEQQELEKEMSMLNQAQDPKEVCQEIISHVDKNGPDPMCNPLVENPFHQNHRRGFCEIL